MPRKYLRGLQYVTGTNGRDVPIFMRTCYEFWAYCVHNNPILSVSGATNATPIQITTSVNHGLSTGAIVGISGVLGNTAANGQFAITVTGLNTFTLVSSVGNGAYTSGGLVTIPGGMPITPLSGPPGFFEGTTTGTTTGQTAATSVVMAVGTDGVTSDLGINFTSLSANFSASMMGKHITIWSHTDVNSTDNSIYRIVNVLSPTQLQIYPFSGGTKDITTLKNNLTSRSALNYRVIDFVAASQLSVAVDNYFVATLSDGYTINVGQANSQFQFKLKGAANAYGQFNIVGSPNGSWNGSTFVSAAGTPSATLTEQTLPTNTLNGAVSGINGAITLIADKTFFIGHVKSNNSSQTTEAGLYFYVTIPYRLYSQTADPNPLAIYVGGNYLVSDSSADSHTTKFNMVFFPGTTATCQLMSKNFAGDGTQGNVFTVGPNLSPGLTVNRAEGKLVYTEAIISNLALNAYCLARAKLRPILFTSITTPEFHLLGDNGEFIHVGNGTVWPWDGSIMPYNLLPLGQ